MEDIEMDTIKINGDSMKSFSHNREVVGMTQDALQEKEDGYESKLKCLRAYLRRNGLGMRFRNAETAAGDFCIFIYDKKIRSNYLVGFDGSWDSEQNDIYSCIKQAYSFVNGYTKGRGSK